MRTAVAALVVFALSTACYANDRAVVGRGGTFKLLKGEHASIRMVSEKVRVTIEQKTYTVIARFLFQNDGPATTVTMGFPETGSGDIKASDYKTKTAFTSFTTTLDGHATTAKRVLVRMEPDEYYTAHWVKDVPFAAGQQRVVEVRYTSPIGSSVEGPLVGYAFTGGNWKGKVRSSVLEVSSRVPGDKFGPASTKPTRTRGSLWIYERRNWEAEETVNVFLPRKQR